MFEQSKDNNTFPAEKSEQEDYRLPYELPKLRKHGKVNDTTLTFLPTPSSFDGFPFRTDVS
jgi:hypothetical protein